MYNGASDLLSVVLEETGGLGVDVVVDCGGRHWLRMIMMTTEYSVYQHHIALFAWSSPARGGVRREEAPPTQTWHHQCTSRRGALGHISQRPAGELVKHNTQQHKSLVMLENIFCWAVGFGFISLLCTFYFYFHSWIPQILDYCS